MSFDSQQAQQKFEDVLSRIRAVNYSIQKDIVEYRHEDRIVDEADEYKTMRDIRYYLLENYHKLDQILTELDRYKE